MTSSVVTRSLVSSSYAGRGVKGLRGRARGWVAMLMRQKDPDGPAVLFLQTPPARVSKPESPGLPLLPATTHPQQHGPLLRLPWAVRAALHPSPMPRVLEMLQSQGTTARSEAKAGAWRVAALPRRGSRARGHE